MKANASDAIREKLLLIFESLPWREIQCGVEAG
jgi:hypothetical protein